jgi:DNA-binding beta-propeller fold protein YncE
VSTLDGVQVLNARTGASIHTLKVGGTPGAIAIDGRTGNAYVIPDPTVAAEPGAPDALDTLVLRLRRWLPWLSRPAAPRAATDAVTVLNPSG